MRRRSAFLVRPRFVLDQHTHGGRQVGGTLVQVGLDGAVEVGDAAQFELLADLRRQVGDGLLDRGVAGLASGLERIDVGRLRRGRGRHDLVGDRLELGVLRDEVGLGVELDQRAVLGGDQTFGGRSLGALADVLGALDAEEFDGLVEVAVGLDQRVLGVEHAGTGEVAKSLHIGSGVVRHFSLSLRILRGLGGGGGGGRTGIGRCCRAGEQFLLPLGERLGPGPS